MAENPVHMVRFYCDENANSFLIDSFIPQYLINLQGWEHESHPGNDPPILRDNGPPGFEPHHRADWYFDFNEDESVFLANLWGYVPHYSTWAVMKYHVCDHADDAPSGCSWDDTKERVHGNPPDWV